MPRAATAGTAGRTLAVLRFAGIRVALDQGDLGDLESAADLRPAQGGLGIGCIDSRGRPWPVFALDASLRTTATREASRRVCVLVSLGQAWFGLLVDDVALLDPRRASAFPLPDAMRRHGTPVQSLLRVDDGLIVHTGAGALAAHAGIGASRVAAAFAETTA